MINSKPHPHAAFVKKWLEDTSRPVQSKLKMSDNEWSAPQILNENIGYNWSAEYEFRFSEAPKEIVSSLKKEDFAVFSSNQIEELREVANLAAKRAIEDLRPPTWEEAESLFPDSVKEYIKNPGIIQTTIEAYLQAVKEGKL